MSRFTVIFLMYLAFVADTKASDLKDEMIRRTKEFKKSGKNRFNPTKFYERDRGYHIYGEVHVFIVILTSQLRIRTVTETGPFIEKSLFFKIKLRANTHREIQQANTSNKQSYRTNSA